jgi:uncharacterized membrane protein
MHLNHLQYMPIAPVFFVLLLGLFAGLVLFVHLGILQYAAPLAYIGGSLGTLIGADLLNLPNTSALSASVASIGGAGTFDGIFVKGIMAVLLASFTGRRRA